MFKERAQQPEPEKNSSKEGIVTSDLNSNPEIKSDVLGASGVFSGDQNKELIEVGLEDAKWQKTEKFFENMGFIRKTEDGQSFDLENIKNLNTTLLQNQLKSSYKNIKYYINRVDIIKFLNKQSGFIKDDPEKKIKPFFSLPLSAGDAMASKFEDGHCFPWGVGKTDWANGINLPNGETVSLPDLFYLQKMKELGFHRNEEDELVYYDLKTGQLKKFTSRNAPEIFGRDISFKNNNGSAHSLQNSPSIFIKKYLPLIDSMGIFKEGDFRRMSSGSSYEIALSHDRKFNANGPSYYNGVVEEVDIRYYLGKNNIVGTDKKIEDNMFIRDLSSEAVGIVQDEHERKKIIYTFDKMNADELGKIGAFNNKDYFIVGAEEMATRIKKYKITDFLPQRKNESSEEYANRLADLSDIDFVMDKFRSVTIKADIPLAQFSWAEQLMIANYSLSGNKADKLIDFSSKYGAEGLKTFLVVERDSGAGKLILDIGSKLNPEQARAIFSKVSELGVLANKEKEELAEMLLNDKQDEVLVGGVYGKVMDMASESLRQFQKIINQSKNPEKEVNGLLEKLQLIKTDNALLISVLKSAKEDGQEISLEMIKGLKLEKRNIIKSESESGINKTEKDKLLEIAQENYSAIFLQPGPSYNPEAYQRVIDDFAQELDNLDGQTVYILRYKKDIIGFNRFKKTSPYEVYAGSFNVTKDIQGLSVGKSFLAQTLEDISESYDIRAKTRKDNPANNSYLRQGFVIVGEHQEADGVSYYDIIKPSHASNIDKIA